jgi:hypothetical protein
MEAQLISALQAQGILVDKRWTLARLMQEAQANGVEIPEAPAADLELEIPKPAAPEPKAKPAKAAKAPAPAKAEDEGTLCISLIAGLHISKKDLVNTLDDGLSAKFFVKDRFRLNNAALAKSLEDAGKLVIVQ